MCKHGGVFWPLSSIFFWPISSSQQGGGKKAFFYRFFRPFLIILYKHPPTTTTTKQLKRGWLPSPFLRNRARPVFHQKTTKTLNPSLKTFVCVCVCVQQKSSSGFRGGPIIDPDMWTTYWPWNPQNVDHLSTLQHICAVGSISGPHFPPLLGQ